jgi:hypothetical protein
MDIPLCGDINIEKRLKNKIERVILSIEKERIEEEEEGYPRSKANQYMMEETISTIYLLRCIRYIIKGHHNITKYIRMNSKNLLLSAKILLNDSGVMQDLKVNTKECCLHLFKWADILIGKREDSKATSEIVQYYKEIDMKQYYSNAEYTFNVLTKLATYNDHNSFLLSLRLSEIVFTSHAFEHVQKYVWDTFRYKGGDSTTWSLFHAIHIDAYMNGSMTVVPHVSTFQRLNHTVSLAKQFVSYFLLLLLVLVVAIILTPFISLLLLLFLF